MNTGMYVSKVEPNCEGGQVASPNAEKKSQTSTWQSFRLTPAEKEMLREVASRRGVSVSTLLRSLIHSVSDGSE